VSITIVRKKRPKITLRVPQNSQGIFALPSVFLAGCTLRSDPYPDCLADHLRARRFGALDQVLIEPSGLTLSVEKNTITAIQRPRAQFFK
jgi:hypothetical protein